MIDYENFWSPEGNPPGLPRLDDELLARCEQKLGVKFPASLVALYRYSNGGTIRGCYWPSYLLPLNDDDTFNYGQCIRSLDSYAERGEIISEDALDWIEELQGDPKRIFLFWTDGHVGDALNFNKLGPSGEPTIVYFDTESCSANDRFDSFEQWLEWVIAFNAEKSREFDEMQAATASAFAAAAHAGIPAEYEAILVQFEAATATIAALLTGITDDSTADAALAELEAAIDQLATFGLQLGEWMSSLDDHDPTTQMAYMRIVQGSTQLNEQVYRIQYSVPEAANKIVQAVARMHPSGSPQDTAPYDASLLDEVPPPRSAPPSGIVALDEATRELVELLTRFREIVSGISNEKGAKKAMKSIAKHSDRYGALLRRISSAAEPNFAAIDHLRTAEKQLEAELARLQQKSPAAHSMLEGLFNQLITAAFKPDESEELRLVDDWNLATEQLARTLASITGAQTAHDTLERLDQQAAEYEQFYDRFMDAVANLETLQVGMLWHSRGAARAELQGQVSRIQHGAADAYKVIRPIMKRLMKLDIM